MSKLEALSLGDAGDVAVKLHPTVVFSILNHFIRRTDRDSRVIGTLLGYVKNGVVEITECFGVPHIEKKEELMVAITKDYHKQMYSFHRKTNRKEKIVGWYTTTSPEGALINDISSLIHNFYSAECANPVHIVVDTTLAGDTMGVRGFVSAPLMISELNLARKFNEVKVDFTMTDSESTCLFTMMNGYNLGSGSSGARASTAVGESKQWESSQVVAKVPTQRETVNASMEKLLRVLDDVQAYVDGVVAGKTEPCAENGMKIADAVVALQSVRPEDFQAVLQDKIQDLLMVSYISSLAATQLEISEKINQIL
jgi:translation initiation factor 3 subunit F